MIHRTLALVCLFACTPAVAHAAIAANQIPNPHFDDDAGISGWLAPNPGPAALNLDPLDELGDVDSGSLRVHNLSANGVTQSKSECFTVDDLQSVVFGASSLSQPVVSLTTVAVLQFWSNPTCMGAVMTGKSLTSDLDGYSSHTWVPVQGYGQVPLGAQSARLALTIHTKATPPAAVLFDNAFVYQGIRCAGTSTVACLNDGRFRFHAQWEVPEGLYGQGRVRLFPAAGDSAYASFFSPSNVELVVKVLDACALNERYWVFASGLTNVEAVVAVKDTSTGASWSRLNPQGAAFQPIQDTAAFATCPH